jgi:hypothetical protein
VHRQVDALQPDDQDEHQAAAAKARQQGRDVAGGERADPEQREPEHRLGDPGLDVAEGDQRGDAADDQRQHERARPAHHVAAVGLDAVGDADEDGDQAGREGQVAPPVELGGLANAELLELEVGPDGAQHAERDGDEEDEPPVDGAEQAAEDQADEAARDAGDLVEAQRHAALVVREGVGEDGA